MFFQPDPTGYADSVNLYAGMMNNPVGFRDPSGLVGGAFVGFFERASQAVAETAPRAVEDSGEAIQEFGNGAAEGERGVQSTIHNEPLGNLTGANSGNRLHGLISDEERLSQANSWYQKGLQSKIAKDIAESRAKFLREEAEQAGRVAMWRPMLQDATDKILEMFRTRWGRRLDTARANLSRRIVLYKGANAEEDIKSIVHSTLVPPRENMFDVFMHGSAFRVSYNGIRYSAQDLADMIRACSGWRKGMRVRIFACSTGAEERGFAQQVANALGEDAEVVYAPNRAHKTINGPADAHYLVPKSRRKFVGRQNEHFCSATMTMNLYPYSRHRSFAEAQSYHDWRRVFGFGQLFLLFLTAALAPVNASGASAPLASMDYHIAGTYLQVSPSTLSVPTGIAGSVLVSVVAGGSTNNAAVSQLTSGAYVQAIIRGPAFETPQTIVAAANSP